MGAPDDGRTPTDLDVAQARYALAVNLLAAARSEFAAATLALAVARGDLTDPERSPNDDRSRRPRR